jgi:NAD(P)-dependent dehydrogenase (short-subunit alcohol dehydrogenase family)
MRRLGQAGDVAPMVAILVSPKNGSITGRPLGIRGGLSMV